MNLNFLDKRLLFQKVPDDNFTAHGYSEQPTTRLHFLGVASGLGAIDQGCALGPLNFLTQVMTTQFQDHGIHVIKDLALRIDGEKRIIDSLSSIHSLLHQLASRIHKLVLQEEKFLVMGGDHSCAIGTWSGASLALSESGPIGLLWIDAHMDSHTPVTSHTGALHGMPLACLLGYGDQRFTGLLQQSPKLQADKVCLLAARSYESEEARLLDRLGVKVIFMDEIKQQGLATCVCKALEIVNSNNSNFGISLDLDALDPLDAPGVGSPVVDGINARQLISSLKNIAARPGFIGMEIAEFNPCYDQAGKTRQICIDLITHVYGRNAKEGESHEQHH